MFYGWRVVAGAFIAQLFVVGFYTYAASLLVGPVTYGVLNWQLPQVAFLNHMAITFLVLVAIMTAITIARPRAEPFRFPRRSDVDLTPAPWARISSMRRGKTSAMGISPFIAAKTAGVS